MQKVIIYTDGACSGNPGPGGWGAILMAGENKKEISGGKKAAKRYQTDWETGCWGENIHRG